MTILDAEYLLTRTRDGEGLGDEVDEALDMAIKALKQYGALQEIRQEIEIQKKGFPSSADYYHRAINRSLDIIDKHIKEIEG